MVTTQRTQHGGHREFRCLHLGHRNHGLEFQGRDRLFIRHDAFVAAQIGRQHTAQGPKRRDRLSEMRGARRHLPIRAACRMANEGLGLAGRRRRYARPYRTPQQVGEGHHGLCVNSFVGLRHDLRGRRAGAQGEAFAMCPTHAERIPYLQALQGVVRLQEHQQHLVGAHRVGRAARGGHDAVRLDGIGNDRGLALEGDLFSVMLDGGLAGTDITARLTFGGRRCHEQLFGGDAAEDAFERGIALGMPCDARHLDLVHGVNQRGRRAGLAQDVTDVGNFRDTRAFAAEGLRHLDAEKPLLADFGEGLDGETSLRIDRRRIRLGHVGRRAGACNQVVLSNRSYPGSARHSLRFH